MAKLNDRHWTERSTDDYLYRIGADFIRQIEAAIEADGESQSKLAATLGVTKGRVSQVLSKPGNLTLRKVIEYSRALGRKVSIVTYMDGDSENINGPVNSQIFTKCWEMAGRPSDFFELRHAETAANRTMIFHQPSARSVVTGSPLRFPPFQLFPVEGDSYTPNTSGGTKISKNASAGRG